MAKYKYQPRTKIKPNVQTSKIAERELTIKKIEADLSLGKIKLTFEGGTRHVIHANDYNKWEFEILSKCLSIGDKVLIAYDQASSRIIRCYIPIKELQWCGVVEIQEIGEDRFELTLGETEFKITVDSSVVCMDESLRKLKLSAIKILVRRDDVVKVYYIGERIAGIII